MSDQPRLTAAETAELGRRLSIIAVRCNVETLVELPPQAFEDLRRDVQHNPRLVAGATFLERRIKAGAAALESAPNGKAHPQAPDLLGALGGAAAVAALPYTRSDPGAMSARQLAFIERIERGHASIVANSAGESDAGRIASALPAAAQPAASASAVPVEHLSEGEPPTKGPGVNSSPGAAAGPAAAVAAQGARGPNRAGDSPPSVNAAPTSSVVVEATAETAAGGAPNGAAVDDQRRLEGRVRKEALALKIKRAAHEVLEREQAAKRVVEATCAADIKPLPVRWLWRDRLPLGQLALLAGREGLGKSSVAYERAARITRGDLDGDVKGEPRAVIVAATEDSWEHTIVPRLLAAGADLKLVFKVRVAIADLGAFELALPDDVNVLGTTVIEKRAALVLLDPVISRLNKRLDTHKDADVRGGLEPLARLADETGACVLGIIHVNKSSSRDPLTTVMGSRAFTATARAVLYVAQDPDDPRKKLLGQAKNNLGKSGDDLDTLTFRIEGATVETIEGPAATSRIVWDGTSTLSVADVVAEAADGGGRSDARNAEAREWLRDYMAKLPGGQAPSKEIKADAKRVGHAERTLQRAFRALGLKSTSDGFPATTTWALPEAAVQTRLPEEM